MTEYRVCPHCRKPITDGWIETVEYVVDVRVVRCRDCKHYKPYRTHHHGVMNRCVDEQGHWHRRDENDFCSKGERRES